MAEHTTKLFSGTQTLIETIDLRYPYRQLMTNCDLENLNYHPHYLIICIIMEPWLSVCSQDLKFYGVHQKSALKYDFHEDKNTVFFMMG